MSLLAPVGFRVCFDCTSHTRNLRRPHDRFHKKRTPLTTFIQALLKTLVMSSPIHVPYALFHSDAVKSHHHHLPPTLVEYIVVAFILTSLVAVKGIAAGDAD